MSTIWKSRTFKTEHRSRVVKVGPPTQSGTGGIPRLGKFRIYWSVGWGTTDRSHYLLPTIVVQSGGYIEELKAQGWGSGAVSTVWGRWFLDLKWRLHDHPAVFDPQYRVWRNRHK